MSDPFDYRCDRCGTPLVADGVCGLPECRTDLEALRAGVAWLCRRVLGGARWLGIVR